jgi:hypothetical protein
MGRTKFETDKYGPDLLAWLRARGPVPLTAAQVRDAVDALDAHWPASPAPASAWSARIKIALKREAYDRHPDAPAHRKAAAAVRAELGRLDLHQDTLADRVGIPTGRLSQLLNCYVRWTPAEAVAVGTALRLSLPIPPDQGTLTLTVADPGPPILPPPAPALPARAPDPVNRLRAAIAVARGHLGAVLMQTVATDDPILIDHVRAALAALEGAP